MRQRTSVVCVVGKEGGVKPRSPLKKHTPRLVSRDSRPTSLPVDTDSSVCTVTVKIRERQIKPLTSICDRASGRPDVRPHVWMTDC